MILLYYTKTEDPQMASNFLQLELDSLNERLKSRRVKVNEKKSAHDTFTTRHETCPPVTLINVFLPQVDEQNILACTSFAD
jgi:hypothetical protein